MVTEDIISQQHTRISGWRLIHYQCIRSTDQIHQIDIDSKKKFLNKIKHLTKKTPITQFKKIFFVEYTKNYEYQNIFLL